MKNIIIGLLLILIASLTGLVAYQRHALNKASTEIVRLNKRIDSIQQGNSAWNASQQRIKDEWIQVASGEADAELIELYIGIDGLQHRIELDKATLKELKSIEIRSR
jgi:hypothetical protein